jgi:hypothetical protein
MTHFCSAKESPELTCGHLRHARNKISELEQELNDYKEVLADKHRLIRELDVLLNGSGAAQQASLIDIISQVRRENIRSPSCPPYAYVGKRLDQDEVLVNGDIPIRQADMDLLGEPYCRECHMILSIGHAEDCPKRHE